MTRASTVLYQEVLWRGDACRQGDLSCRHPVSTAALTSPQDASCQLAGTICSPTYPEIAMLTDGVALAMYDCPGASLMLSLCAWCGPA